MPIRILLDKDTAVIVSKNIEHRENSSVRLSVTVSKEDVRSEYDKLLTEYAKNIHLDGFRKGKVPIAVLERKYGNDIRMDAMGKIMQAAVEEALKDAPEKPLPYSNPLLEGEPEFLLDKDFTFSVLFDILPDVKIGDLSKLELEVPVCDIVKDDEKRELEEIRQRNAIVVDKDDKAKAEKGDIVTVNYHELDDAGATIAGTERQDFVFEIGTGYNIYKFDDDVLGMLKDQEKVLDKSFPADFEYKDLAGQKKRISVRVTQLKAKKLPELDDDLAQDVSEKFKTLDDLKADIKSKLEKSLEHALKQAREKALIDILHARSQLSLPKSMLDAELEMRLRNFMRQMGMDDPSKLDKLLSATGRTLDDLLNDWKPVAEHDLRTRLIIEKLVTDGKFEASDDDIAAEYARMAGESSMSVDEIKAEYEKRSMTDYLKDRIKEDKLMSLLIAGAKIKKGAKVAYVDLVKESQ